MSFKIHLVIISCIVVVVALAWVFLHNPAIQAIDAAPVKSTYSLSITHASWGLNCRDNTGSADPTQGAFLTKPDTGNKLHEDNVLAAVSRLCNGNLKCDVTLDEDSLGPDPAPTCPSKNLEIEYRCFSYDRPWNIKISTGVASLHCDQSEK